MAVQRRRRLAARRSAAAAAHGAQPAGRMSYRQRWWQGCARGAGSDGPERDLGRLKDGAFRHPRSRAREDRRAGLGFDRTRSGRLSAGTDRFRDRARAGAPGCPLPRRGRACDGAGHGRGQPVRGRVAPRAAARLGRRPEARSGPGEALTRTPLDVAVRSFLPGHTLRSCEAGHHPRVAIIGA